MTNDKISIGNCGQYFVAAELERHGFTAAVPMSNTRDFDILAINRNDSSKQYAIQVKTNSGNKLSWVLNKKNETIIGKNIYYVFVNLNDGESPDYFIVPSKTVATYISSIHQEWLNTAGKHGQKHNDSSMRKFAIDDNDLGKYKNNWSILK